MDRNERDARPGAGASPVATEEALRTAVELHKAGRLAEAAASYERILAADGANADALYALGVVHLQAGLPARAEELIGLAAALRPNVAAILATWARASLALGDDERAAEHARDALRLTPDDPLARRILGLALRGRDRQGRGVEAARSIDATPGPVASGAARNVLDAVSPSPGLAAAHADLGMARLREGRFAEAQNHLKRATEVEPGRAAHWERLAELHARTEEFDAAIACWERVLALALEDRAYPRLALGWALQEVNRFDEAEAHFRAAAAIEPDAPEPPVNLGLLAMERGRFDAAETAFRTALRRRPSYELAHYWLANLLDDRLPEADLGALMARLDHPATAPEPRTRLLFAAGKVFDARGEYARAAEALREANALHLTLARGPRRLDPVEHERFVGSLIAAFDRGFFARLAGAGLETRTPVFIVGLPRSGTTLIEQILASHPRVHGAGELPIGRLAFETLPAVMNQRATPAECAKILDRATLRRLAEDYHARLQEIAGAGVERVVDKLPENYFNLGILLALFPNATVIHCRRDLRDVALSCWMADFRSLTWTNDAVQIASVVREYLRIMAHWRSVAPTTIHEVDYEETVADLEGVARRLVAALGLEWDPACLDFHRASRPVRTASRMQVRKPLYTRSVGRWKNYERELADLFAALPTEATPPA